MQTELSNNIKAKLHIYFVHRQHHHPKGIWDKEGDIRNIEMTARAEGWGVEHSAGTFWFRRKALIGDEIIEVTERTLSKGGKSNMQRDDFFGFGDDLTHLVKKFQAVLVEPRNRRCDEYMNTDDKCVHCELFWTLMCDKHDVAWEEAKEKYILSDLEDQFNRLNFIIEKFKDCADFIRTENQNFHNSEM